jgi:hypothetical protein
LAHLERRDRREVPWLSFASARHTRFGNGSALPIALMEFTMHKQRRTPPNLTQQP